MNAPAVVLQLVALQLFAALAFATPAADSRALRARDSSTSDSASSGPRSSGAPVTQRRRRARRRRAPEALLPGVWGGDHVRLEVTDGGARVEYDCAHATVEGRILVDGAGRFSVAGTFYREHGGPVREGEASNGLRVRLDGRVGGSLMTLKVTRAGKTLDTHTLTRDREAQLFKCR
jgi:hypothetical protein